MYRHPFKRYIIADRRKKVDKDVLREDIKAATQEYLKAGKKIEKFMDGPAVIRSIIDRGDSMSIRRTTIRELSIALHMCLRDPIRFRSI